jgi:hypothetical protein
MLPSNLEQWQQTRKFESALRRSQDHRRLCRLHRAVVRIRFAGFLDAHHSLALRMAVADEGPLGF